jgi:hypothetical protein
MIEHDLCSTIVNIDYSAVAIKMQKECSRAQCASLQATVARATDYCTWLLRVRSLLSVGREYRKGHREGRSFGSDLCDRTAPSRNRHDTARCAYVVMECSQLLFDGSTFDFVIDKASNLSLGLA